MNFERILNNHVDGVLVVDGTFRIAWANQALVKLLGISRDEVVGKYCPELLHGTPEPVEECPCLCARGTSERRISEVAVPGRDVILESISDPVLDETGKFTGAVLVFRDITGRKARESRDALKSRRLELLSNIWSNLFTLGDIGWSDPRQVDSGASGF